MTSNVHKIRVSEPSCLCTRVANPSGVRPWVSRDGSVSVGSGMNGQPEGVRSHWIIRCSGTHIDSFK